MLLDSTKWQYQNESNIFFKSEISVEFGHGLKLIIKLDDLKKSLIDFIDT